MPSFNMNSPLAKEIIQEANEYKKRYCHNKMTSEFDKDSLTSDEKMFAEGLYRGFREGAKWVLKKYNINDAF